MATGVSVLPVLRSRLLADSLGCPTCSPEAALALRQRLNETVDELDEARRELAQLEVKFDAQERELTVAKSDRASPFDSSSTVPPLTPKEHTRSHARRQGPARHPAHAACLSLDREGRPPSRA